MYGQRRLVIAQGGGGTALTGTLAQTDIVSCTIPAMGANDMIEVRAAISCNNNANAKTLYLLHGGSSVIAVSVASTNGAQIRRNIANRNSVSVQRSWITGSLTNDGTLGGSSFYSGAVDTSSAKTLSITGLLSNTGDNITVEWWQVLLWRA